METLHIMCSKGDTWYVKRHLDKGSDVNAKDDRGNTPLDYAAYGGSKEVAELFIAEGADVKAKNKNGFLCILRLGKTIRKSPNY